MKTQISSYTISIGKQYFFSTILMFIFLILLYTIQESIGYQTVSLILLLIIFLLPFFNFGKGPMILCAVISAFAWDYYFIPPQFTLHINRAEDVMMLFMFFIVAVTNSILTTRLKIQKNLMTEKERRSNALYFLLKELANANDQNDVLKKTVNQIVNVFGFETTIFFPADQNKLKSDAHPASNFIPDDIEWLAAETAYSTKTETGNGTGTVQGAFAKYFPLIKDNSVLCVVGVKINNELKSDLREMDFLNNFLKEIIPFLEKHSE